LTTLKLYDHNKSVIKKTVLVFLILILFVVFLPIPSYAGPQIPPIAEGPGLILPDSPLFFLDKIKQEVRLFFAFSLQNKAKTYSAIAGERLAELRFMLARNNKNGIEVDLKGISENLENAANSLTEAQFRGENVELLSENINNDIKRRQDSLDILLSQSTGELKAMVLGVQTSIYQSKTKIESGLPVQKMENEVRDDLIRQITSKIGYASDSSREILLKLGMLKNLESESSAKSIKIREEELRKATSLKNTAQIKEKQSLLDFEKKNQEKIFAAYQRLTEAAKKAQDATAAYQRAQQELYQLLNQSSAPVPIPTCRPRPACLDAIPRCLIAETSGMCPRTK